MQSRQKETLHFDDTLDSNLNLAMIMHNNFLRGAGTLEYNTRWWLANREDKLVVNRWFTLD